MKPTYFDLSVHDVDAARAFFEKVLDWRFEKFPMPYEYYLIRGGLDTDPGINGGIGRVADAPISRGNPMTQVTIPVPDLDRTLGLVMKHGGKIVERNVPIPGVGWYATCAEPGGLMFGVIQPDEHIKSTP